MVKYRQPIRPNDVGLDVLAVKRAMKKAPTVQDASRLKLNRRAGAAFVHCIKALQHNHHLKVDGIYGPLTHNIIAPKFDAWGERLYNKAAIREHAGSYINPFHLAKITLSRTDMGVDFHGVGPIVAIGDALITGSGGHGWPGGHYLNMQLQRGAHAGKYWYTAEAIEVLVHVGQHVERGQVIAHFGYYAAPGRYPGIEVGWSSPTTNETRAAATTGYYEGQRTPAGKAAARFLRSLGCPTLENPGNGPHYV